MGPPNPIKFAIGLKVHFNSLIPFIFLPGKFHSLWLTSGANGTTKSSVQCVSRVFHIIKSVENIVGLVGGTL